MKKIMNPLSRQLERDVYMGHIAWLAAQDPDSNRNIRFVGAERLEVNGQALLGFVASALDLSGARFSDCDLSHGNLSNTTLVLAEFNWCRLSRANLHMADLGDTWLANTSFGDSRLTLARLDGADVQDCDFSNTDCRRLETFSTRVFRCSFEAANLEDVSFVLTIFRDCTFRDARLCRRASAEGLGHAHACTFSDCDLRGVDWSGFRVTKCTFQNCAFSGGTGIPGDLENVTITGADLSVAADRTGLSFAENVLRRWRSGDLGIAN